MTSKAHLDHSLGTPLDHAVWFLRNTIAQSPHFGNTFEVINIERVHPDVLVLDLNDGTTIRLDVSRYPRSE